MRTIDGGRPGSTLRRDLSLLWRMAAMVAQYATAGAALRRAYRRCEARGEVFRVDVLGATRHREEPLRPR